MRHGDRPTFWPLGVLAIGLAAVTAGVVLLWWRYPLDLHGRTWDLVGFLGAGLVLVVALAPLLWPPSNPELRAVRAIVAVWAVLAGLAASSFRVIDAWTWVQFLVLLVMIAVAMWLVAAEWSRRSMLAIGTIFLILASVFVVRVGYHTLRSSVVEKPIEKARAEEESLRPQATNALTAGINASGPGFQPTARRVGDALLKSPPDLAAAQQGQADLLALELPAATEDRAPVLALRDEARAAIAAYETGRLDRAIGAACAAASASGAHRACPGTPKGPDAGIVSTPARVEAVLHRLRTELAYYRASVTNAESDKAAAEAAAKADPEKLDFSLYSSFTAGPGAIVDSIDPENPLHLVPGPVGWILLGVAALGALRMLLKRNACQLAGPVQITYTGEFAEELKIALLSNLNPPGPAPGTAFTQSITDLSTLAGPQGAFIGPVVTAVNNVLARVPGYVVDADLVPEPPVPKPDAPGAVAQGTQPTRVLVRVTLAASKELVANQQFADLVPERAMQSAGLWAAGLLLSRSTRIPSWAEWNEATAEALGPTFSPDPSMADLERAVATAPRSGLLLELYGAKLEMEGCLREAVAIHARAVAAHPRYLQARYRLAASIGMMARHLDVNWDTAPPAERQAIGEAIHRAADRLGIRVEAAELMGSGAGSELKGVALKLMEGIAKDAAGWRARVATLRRADRDDALRPSHDGASPRHRWNRFRWLAKSAQLPYHPRNEGVLLEDVENEADRPASSWQLSYNLACYYAATSPSTALNRLETCLVRHGIEALKVEWVRTDPDLWPLAAHPRFIRFCNELEGKP